MDKTEVSSMPSRNQDPARQVAQRVDLIRVVVALMFLVSPLASSGVVERIELRNERKSAAVGAARPD